MDPSIKKGDWTVEEDISILRRQKKVGNKWADIAKLLPGRTENSVKIRWKSIKRQVLALQAEREAIKNSQENSLDTENDTVDARKRKAKRNTMDQDRLVKLLEVWIEINKESASDNSDKNAEAETKDEITS